LDVLLGCPDLDFGGGGEAFGNSFLSTLKCIQTALSLRPSLAAIYLFFIPISPQYITLLFSSVEKCFPFPIAMKSFLFFKKTCTGSVCTLGISGKLSTVSVKLIFHHEKGLHYNCIKVILRAFESFL
jgi:hypothetical protein